MGMEEILQGLTWKCCLVFMDDILIYSKDFKSHLLNITQVLKRLQEHGLICKPKKFMFLMKEIPFLGHVVSYKGTMVDHEKIKAIKEMIAPEDVSGVRRFLGM